ncbi:MAG: FHA domain-containing protein [Woeseia sp.]
MSKAGEQSDTLLVICGTDGSGKTTLLNQYISSIDEDRCYAAFDETCQDGMQFYCSFLRQLGFGEITGTLRELRRITREFIINRGHAGEVVLFFLDNAHLVRPEVLEQLRWIAETRVDERRILSIVVAGNLNLRRIMDSPAMSSVQFQNHINFTIRVYSEVETEDYVRHRMRLAGAAEAVQFAEGARALIYRFSGGVPRQINRICDAVLAEAKTKATHLVDEQLIRSVADAHQIMPHVVPLTSKGRRKTDTAREQSSVEDQGEERITTREAEPAATAKAAQKAGPAAANDVQFLLAQVARLTRQLDESKDQISQTLQKSTKQDAGIEVLRAKLVLKEAEAERYASVADKGAEEIVRLNRSLHKSHAALREYEITSRELVAEVTSLREQLKASDTESARLASTINSHEEKIGWLTQLLADNQKSLQDSEAFVDQLTADLDELKNAGTDEVIAHLRTQLDAQSKESESLAAGIASKADEIDKLRDALAESVTALEQHEQDAAALTSHVQQLEEQLATNNSNSAELVETIKRHEAEIAELTKALAESDETRQKQEVTAAGQLAEVEKMQAQLASRQEEALELIATIDEYEGHIQQLTTALDRNAETLLEKNKAADAGAAELRKLQDELAAKSLQAEESAAAVIQHSEELAVLNQALVESKQALLDSEKAAEGLVAELHQLQQRGSDEVIKDLRQQLAAQQKESNKLTTTVEKHSAEMGRLTETLAEREKALKESEKASKALAADIKTLQKQLKAKDKSSGKHEATARKNEQEIARLNQALSEKQAALQNSEQGAKDLAANLKNLQRQLAEKDKHSDKLAARVLQDDEDLAKLAQAVADGRETLRASEKLAKTLAVGLFKFEKSYAAKEIETAQLGAQIKRYNEEIAELYGALANSAAALAEKEESSKAREVELEKVQAEADAKSQELQALLESAQQAEQQIERLTQELGETRTALDDKQEAARLYASELEKLQEQFTSKDEAYAELDANLTQHNEEIAQLTQALSETAAALQEKEAATQALEVELEERQAELAAKAEEAEKFAGAAELADAQIAQLTDELAESRKALSEHERNAAEMVDELRVQLEQQLQETEALGSTSADEIGKLKDALQDKSSLLEKSEETVRLLASDIEKLQDDFENKDAAADILENAVRKNDDEIEKLNAALSDSEARLHESEKVREQLAAEVERLEKSEKLVAELQTEVAAQADELTEMKTSAAGNADEIENLGEALAISAQALQDSEKKSKELLADLDAERAAAKRAATELAKVQKRFEKLDNENTELQIAAEQLRAELKAASSNDVRLELLEQALEEAQQESVELQAELAGLKSRNRSAMPGEQPAADSATDYDDIDPGATTSTLQIIAEEADPPPAKESQPAPQPAAVLPLRKKSHGIAAIDVYRNGLIYQVWDMSKGPARVMIGRAEDCELRLVSRYISRHHAMLFASGEHVLIEDLNSFNGTVVNTEKITRHQLKSDDNIVIGEYNLIPRVH